MSTLVPDKWIVGLNAEASVCDAAERVVAQRVDAVVDQTKAVVKSHGEDDEAVHQLRVSTRRAEAALLAFKSWLRKERRKRAKKILHGLRDAAGCVRTCDVHRALLRESLPGAEPDDLMALEASLLMLNLERRAALDELLRVARRGRRALSDRKGRLARRANASDNGHATPDLAQAGATSLKALAATFCELGQGDLNCREHLHRLRVQGKRLRYAIEIFGATAGDTESLAALTKMLTDLQDRLGHVNDCHEVAERLARHAATADADKSGDESGESANGSTVAPSLLRSRLESIADRFETQCNGSVADFHAWWTSEESAEFRRLLANLAADAKPADQPIPTAVAEAADEPPEVVILARRDTEVEAKPDPDRSSAATAAGEVQ